VPAKGDLKFWKDQIRKAKLYQDFRGRMRRWREYRAWYRNEYAESLVSVNKVFGNGRAMIPQLYFKAPTILVRPRKPRYTQMAKVVESIDTWLIDHIGFKQQIKYMILDAYLVNVGVGKVGYHSISTELPAPNRETTEAVGEMLGAAPEEIEEELVRRKWSYHDYVKPDCPWFLRMRPEDLLVPWGFVDEHETPWVAFRVVRPVEDVKADPVYGNTSGLQPNVSIDMHAADVASPNLLGFLPSSAEFVELYEIWDKRDGTLRVLSLDHDKWLRDEEHELNISGSPCSVLRFNPDGVDFWGISDVEQIRKQVNELNENRTHEIQTKRLANVKVAVDTNVIPESEIVKMTEGRVGPVIRANGPPAGSLYEFATHVPSDMFKVDEVIDKDIGETIGFSRNQAGQFDIPRRTATEANIVQGSAQLRVDERRDLVADLIAETFQDKIHPLLYQNWTERRVIEVTDLGGWVTYTGEMIRGDYNVSVVPDSVLPLNKQQEQQLSTTMFQMFRGDPMIRQRDLYITVLQAFRDVIANPEALLEDEQVMQQKMQMNALQQQLQQGEQGAPARS
jgi:hypothetical protein